MSIILLCTGIVFLVLIGAIVAINYFYNKNNDHSHSMQPVSYQDMGIFLTVALASIYFLTYANLKNEADLLKSQLAIMSQTMTSLKHYRISSKTLDDDVEYLKIIETEKHWLVTAEKFFDDIYTMRKDDQGHTLLIVDSETDYDHNGKFEGERESRTKIGEVYDKTLPELEWAFENQKFNYTESFYTDKWGTWISAFYPIYDLNNHFDGLVGADIAFEKLVRHFLFYDCLLALGFIALYTSVLFVKKNQSTNQLLNLNLKNHLIESEKNLNYQKQFLAVMSHEIRTPLNAIIGSIQLVDSDNLSESDNENLTNAKLSSHILANIIGDILDYSKIESGKINLDKSEIYFSQIFNKINSLFKIQMETKGLKFEMQIDPLISENTYGLDEIRFQQILINFISNAYKFTEVGSIQVLVKPLKVESFSTLLEFRISDTGIGISIENQKKLFQAFQQADSTISRKFGGTGLGLMIAKNLIEIMGGQIYFESQPAKGTTFVFTIWVENLNKNKLHLPSEKNIKKFNFESYKELKILIADDVLINQTVLLKTLNKIGFQADTATNGQQVVTKHQTEQYDIIFMDCQMPVMDGFEATKQIRNIEAEQKIFRLVEIIALTANASTEDKNNCLAVGMDQFISKPFSLVQIENALQLAIERAEIKLKKVA